MPMEVLELIIADDHTVVHGPQINRKWAAISVACSKKSTMALIMRVSSGFHLLKGEVLL